MSKKTVLVQLADFNRVIEFDCPPANGTEREGLLKKVRAAYSERIDADDALTLQIRRQDWNGLFVDFFDDEVPDKGVFKIIVEKAEKSEV